MRVIGGTAAAALAWAMPVSAQPPAAPPVEYDVSFDNAVHHEARITVTYRDVGTAPVRFEMSRSSPGRYAIHEFAKNVYSVSAKNGAGQPLMVGRSDPYGWTVGGHDGTVSVTYTLFADRADGTYSQIDLSHAHLNMPATFLWARGFDARPVRVRFRPADPAWSVATQLVPTMEAYVFTAPNLQYLMDSPTELSRLTVRDWQVDDAGTPRTIRLAVHHAGTEEDVDRFAERAKKVVAAQIALFGDVPDFDHGSYTFIADYLPHASGDGMEHRNSTILTDPRGLHEADFAQIQTLSHEFFHAWVVERLRPAELEPFDFTRANPTPSLWFVEGFTSYYGPLLVRRAGVTGVDDYLASLSATLSGIVNSPGRKYGSPEEMSLRAPFVDAATAVDPTNPNIFTSYYPYGAVIALALDLQLRARFPGVTLDDYMRRLWRSHGVSERPFTPADLQSALADVTGDKAFADEFFATTIRASALPDFAPLFARMGLTLRPKNPDRAWVGASNVEVAGTAATLATPPPPGSPLYAAGVTRGDEILRLGRFKIDSQADWDKALTRHRPGDEVEIHFQQRGAELRASLRFAADPAIEVVRAETAGSSVNQAQRAARAAWLGEEAE